MSNSSEKSSALEPFNLILFGGTGDLAFRKIYPAFYFKHKESKKQEEFNILVVSREKLDQDAFRKQLHDRLKEECNEFFNEEDFGGFFEHLVLIEAPEATKKGYAGIAAEINKYPDRLSIYYFSTPSSAFEEIADTLSALNLIKDNSRVVLEKPLGHNLASAREINNKIKKAFRESQIYRIDHYLGKETVQNLMVLRFANHLFERAWDGENIDNIQITVAENLGVEKRANYYENSGALRDMIQNHLLQLLCLVAMEPPTSLDADNLRDEKLKVLKALRFYDTKTIKTDTVKGQYTRGKIGNKQVNSYLEDIGKYNSDTETFVAIEAHVDNWRWKNVPFYLRTGKRMAARYSDIVINFKEVKHNIFDTNKSIPGNRLIIRLQPEERIELVQMTKVPGPGGYRSKAISLKLDYIDSFKNRLPDAYERLIMDVIRGNQTLFMRQDELEAAWKWTESIMTNWEKVNMTNILYAAGSWGPGDEVMPEGREWINH